MSARGSKNGSVIYEKPQKATKTVQKAETAKNGLFSKPSDGPLLIFLMVIRVKTMKTTALTDQLQLYVVVGVSSRL